MARDEAGRPGAGVPSPTEAEVSRWEWIVGILSGLLVLAAVGYVLYRAITQSSTPPQVEVVVDEVYPGIGGWVVEFWAYNRGGGTAKDLTIEAELVSDTGVIATRSMTFTFIPDDSRRKGGVFFPVDPRLYQLRMYPVGYDVP